MSKRKRLFPSPLFLPLHSTILCFIYSSPPPPSSNRLVSPFTLILVLFPAPCSSLFPSSLFFLTWKGSVQIETCKVCGEQIRKSSGNDKLQHLQTFHPHLRLDSSGASAEISKKTGVNPKKTNVGDPEKVRSLLNDTLTCSLNQPTNS